MDILKKLFGRVKLEKQLQRVEEPVVWQGDLTDDCSANWAGLLLRAECMEQGNWWWAVYDMLQGEQTIDSSIEYDIDFTDGEMARSRAEEVAKAYANMNFVKL